MRTLPIDDRGGHGSIGDVKTGCRCCIVGSSNAAINRSTAVNKGGAWKLANDWVSAWNAHDLDLIMMPYEGAVELTSPAAVQLLGISDGKVVGKPNLRSYFQRGLEVYPELKFYLEDVLWGVNSLVLYYRNQKG